MVKRKKKEKRKRRRTTTTPAGDGIEIPILIPQVPNVGDSERRAGKTYPGEKAPG
jgi:hypothetical protein